MGVLAVMQTIVAVNGTPGSCTNDPPPPLSPSVRIQHMDPHNMLERVTGER